LIYKICSFLVRCRKVFKPVDQPIYKMNRNLIITLVLLIFLIIGCSKGSSLTGLATEKDVAETVGVIEEQQEPDGGCSDSDGGITKETAGKVTGTLNGEEYIIYDKCIAGLLVEYFCENNKNVNQNFRCPEDTKCAGGACRSI
jgi:hypothetical protein